jgi:RNA polymerase sigma-70 factor (ECF subfamily)
MLARELEREGKQEIYRLLGPSIFGRKPPRTHRETARALGMTEDAVKMAVLRLRRRFGKLLREEVAQTLSTDAEIEAEIRSLLAAVRSV